MDLFSLHLIIVAPHHCLSLSHIHPAAHDFHQADLKAISRAFRRLNGMIYFSLRLTKAVHLHTQCDQRPGELKALIRKPDFQADPRDLIWNQRAPANVHLHYLPNDLGKINTARTLLLQGCCGKKK